MCESGEVRGYRFETIVKKRAAAAGAKRDLAPDSPDAKRGRAP